MNFCTFCMVEAQILFTHLTYNIGSLCIDCYIKIQGSCGVCNNRLMLCNIEDDVAHRINVKFINMVEKSIVVCDCCFDTIKQEFPEQMA